MLSEDHIATVRAFLDVADRAFEVGDRLQALEKLWSAAAAEATVPIVT